jgi:hypothetical protein
MKQNNREPENTQNDKFAGVQAMILLETLVAALVLIGLKAFGII